MKDKKNLLSALIGITIGFVLSFVPKQCETDIKPEAVHTIDTIIKIKYVPKVIKENNPPKTVIIYRDREPALRDTLEKQPIIENVEIKGNKVSITTVDTSGIVKTEIHSVSKDSKVTIDNSGQVEEKKKTKVGKIIKKSWKIVKTTFTVIGVVTVAVIIGSNL